MLKISDILKKNKERRENKKSLSGEESNADGVHEKNPAERKTSREIKQKNPPKAGLKESKPSPILFEETIQLENSDNAEVENIYKNGISLSERMETLSAENWAAFEDSAKKLVDKFIAVLEKNENDLLKLFFCEYYSSRGYLFQHSVNVCILSVCISKTLNYSREKTRQVGMSALLHDIGLIKYDDLIVQNRRFSQNDYAEVKKHPIAGLNILEKINSNLGAEILQVIAQEHERLDGSGYPYALEEKDISEMAKLVGIVDSYESMMHARPYRDKFKSENVIKFFTQHKSRFDHRFLKALIDLVGVFPILTPVKLNTRELGIVIRQNYQMPLKPVIKITHDAQGQKIDSVKAIDLALNFSFYIQEGLINHKIKDERESE